MRKLFCLSIVALVILCILNIGNASSYPVGKMKLSAAVIDIEQKTITAKGKAKLTAPNAVINADNIKIDLSGKDGGFSKGTASGNVVMHAKQIDSKTGASRIIDSTSNSAVMTRGENTIVLKGNVTAKITDTEQLNEPAVLNGPISVTIFLNENRIRVEGSEDNLAELTASPKENSE